MTAEQIVTQQTGAEAQAGNVEQAREDAAEAERRTVVALERAAKENETPPPTEAGNAAILNALAQQSQHMSTIEGLLAAQGNQLTEGLNSFSRALANTDISAQRAAESSASVEEAIKPEEQTAPNQGEQPPQIQELPKRQIEQSRSKTWWFGKSANRHSASRTPQ